MLADLVIGSVGSMSPLARRMYQLVEPIDVIPYAADEPNEAMFALGFSPDPPMILAW
jgi:hypothetical protein